MHAFFWKTIKTCLVLSFVVYFLSRIDILALDFGGFGACFFIDFLTLVSLNVSRAFSWTGVTAVVVPGRPGAPARFFGVSGPHPTPRNILHLPARTVILLRYPSPARLECAIFQTFRSSP